MMGFDSQTARMAALQAAASMSPDARIARAQKAAEASKVANAARREAREELATKTRRKMTKKGFSPEQIDAELERLGLITRKRYASHRYEVLPTEDELEGYYKAVDEKFPGLTWSQRKRQAIAMMKADIARLERRTK